MTSGYNARMRTLTPDQLRDEIIAARREQGIGQAQAATAAGISQPAWSYWERGQRDVAPATLIRMAAAVGIEVDGPVFIVRSGHRKIFRKKFPTGVDGV